MTPTFADRVPVPWWCGDCGATGSDLGYPSPCPACGSTDGPGPPEVNEPPSCDAHDWEYTRDLTLRECQVCGVQEHDSGGFEPPAPDKYGRPADPAYWTE